MKPSHVVTTAILGILAGTACGGAQSAGATPRASVDPKTAKDGCGNHPPGACGASDTAKPVAQETSSGPLAIARTRTVAPREQLEINLTFTEVTSAKATFKASSPVGWNVHSHPHGEVVIHQKGSGAAGEIAFQPPAPGTYSLMWTNDGAAPVTLEVNVAAEHGVHELRD